MLAHSSEKSSRSRQAFLLGWPIANLGGVNEVVRNLVREFENSGALAPLVIEAPGGLAQHPLPQEIPLLRLSLPSPYDRRHPLKTLLFFCLHLPALFWRLRATCRRHNIEILNPHFIGLEHLALVLFRRSGCFGGKLLLSFHGSDVRSMVQSKGLQRLLSRLLLRGADTLIPCSEGLAEEILMLVPECADRIVPIQNGIDIDHFVASSNSDVELPETFLRRKRLLNIGAFEHKKGHDVLLRAFAEVRQSREDVCLIIVGQTRETFDATQLLIEALGLRDDVLLFRDIPHSSVAALLRCSDVFVLSSRWEKGVCGEGFAMALLEAGAAQKPVVSTRSCGVDELLTDGESGLIVPPERPDLLAQAIRQFLADPADAARQARNLHNEVRQHFTWAAAHSRYLEIASKTTLHGRLSPAMEMTRG